MFKPLLVLEPNLLSTSITWVHLVRNLGRDPRRRHQRSIGPWVGLRWSFSIFQLDKHHKHWKKTSFWDDLFFQVTGKNRCLNPIGQVSQPVHLLPLYMLSSFSSLRPIKTHPPWNMRRFLELMGLTQHSEFYMCFSGFRLLGDNHGLVRGKGMYPATLWHGSGNFPWIDMDHIGILSRETMQMSFLDPTEIWRYLEYDCRHVFRLAKLS